MAEISNRAVATAAAGALLAVGLAFVGSADASHQYDETARCNGRAVHDVRIVARTSDRRSVTWRNGSEARSAPPE